LYGRMHEKTGRKERCAMLYESKSVRWNDVACSNHEAFVCKKREPVNTVFTVCMLLIHLQKNKLSNRNGIISCHNILYTFLLVYFVLFLWVFI
jgi:hypothetical protein